MMKIMTKNFQEQIFHLNTFCCFSSLWSLSSLINTILKTSSRCRTLFIPSFLYLLAMFSFQQFNISKLPIILNILYLTFLPKVSQKLPIPGSDLFFFFSVILERKNSCQEGFELCLTLKAIGKQPSNMALTLRQFESLI